MSNVQRARLLRMIGLSGSTFVLAWIVTVLVRNREVDALSAIGALFFALNLAAPLVLITFLPRRLAVSRRWFVFSAVGVGLCCIADALTFLAMERSTSSTAGLMIFYPMMLAWALVVVIRASAEVSINRARVPPRPDIG